MQLPRHLHGEAALAREHVGGALARADEAAEIGLCIAADFHAVPDGVDRIGRIDRPMPALVVLDDKGEQVEAVSGGRASLWRLVEIALNRGQCRVVVSLAAQWADYF